MSESKAKLRYRWLILTVVCLAVLTLPGTSLYYEYSGGRACARCHEIWQPYTDWHSSTHRNIPCGDCHGNVFTLEAGFHINNMRRVFDHLSGRVPDQVRLRTSDDMRVTERCQKCHREEWAEWASGEHHATYEQIFLNAKHNRKRLLMDDCLRCHGTHFDGGIRDLVTPINTEGPWQLRDPRMAHQPVIICLNCHVMHHHGDPLKRPAEKPTTSTNEELTRPSVAHFDRREMLSVPLADLPLPMMKDGEREVKISPDQRQALCYQCHAPDATRQVRSGDDRTPVGIHEGLSCHACHENHSMRTRASCANCHPRLSNCGLDVEKMDTTFKSTKSTHNIHFVKCIDCHAKGIPKKHRPDAPVQLTSSSELTESTDVIGAD